MTTLTTGNHATLADFLRDRFDRAPARVAYELLLVACGVGLVAASARISVMLPFSPVPITGQTFAVLLIGAAYGSLRGPATMLAYLAMGVAGAPVFAGGGAFVGVTAGYLVGFVAATWIVGTLAERGWDRRLFSTLIAMTLGTAAIFICGLLWLSAVLSDAQNLWEIGLLWHLPGAAIKIALAAMVLPGVWRILGRNAR